MDDIRVPVPQRDSSSQQTTRRRSKAAIATKYGTLALAGIAVGMVTSPVVPLGIAATFAGYKGVKKIRQNRAARQQFTPDPQRDPSSQQTTLLPRSKKGKVGLGLLAVTFPYLTGGYLLYKHMKLKRAALNQFAENQPIQNQPDPNQLDQNQQPQQQPNQSQSQPANRWAGSANRIAKAIQIAGQQPYRPEVIEGNKAKQQVATR